MTVEFKSAMRRRTAARGPIVLRLGPYTFKQASTDAEVEQVHRLNYLTFVREVRQYADNGGERLVDKFHDKNTYLIGMLDDQVIGMVAAHSQPPFSVVDRLADPSVLDRLGGRLLEVRLLAVGTAHRNSMVFAGLGRVLVRFARSAGYTHVVISGIATRRRFYERLGFEALGPPTRSGEAAFIPMVMPVTRGPHRVARLVQRFDVHLRRQDTGRVVFLTPGPVQVAPNVRRAFRRPAVYHRGGEFTELFEGIRRGLSDLVGGPDVALLCGSGTLANDAIAANLAADASAGTGVVLVNGEFGERLLGHAARAGLRFRTLTWDWGRPWDLRQIEAGLADASRPGWVWAVHLESSTGVLNDLAGLVRIGHQRGVRVCVDCMSSVGALPLDLSGVHMASGASGKALGSYAGVSFVCAGPGALESVDNQRVLPSLDLAGAIRTRGPRFTFPSPQIVALHEALREYGPDPTRRAARFSRYQRMGALVRDGLRSAGIAPIAGDACASPVITSFICPQGASADEFVGVCRGWGFVVGGASRYLVRRGWAQIATMGRVRESDLERFLGELARWMKSPGAAGS